MLKEMGCVYVIVGHSERRQFFAETDETVNRRMKTVIAHGMKPIFCIGEMLKEREENRTFSVVERQIEGGLKDIKENEVKTVVIAYEPVWAIGTGKTATPQQAEEVHRFIRQKLERLYSQGVAEAVRIQYGGSVTPENVKGLMDQETLMEPW
jgi:triosephosphate isomerase